MEDDPSLRVKYDGESIPFNRRTAALFRFLGDSAVYDHVFILVQPEDPEADTEGLYVFKDHSLFPELAQFIENNEFIMHVNLPEPSDMDRTAFDGSHYNDLRSSDFPPDWSQE